MMEATAPSRIALGGIGARLAVASFIVLAQELTLIRWLPGQVRVLAYFPNVVLIAAFLGLGIGCLLTARRTPHWLWPVSLVVLCGTAAGLSKIAFTETSASEHLWLLYYDLPKEAPLVHGIRIPILLLFVLSAVTFVPLGQYVADRLREFRAAGRSLTGYSCDLAGSLLGVIGFTLISYAGLFPIVWFAVVLGLGVVLYAGQTRASVAHLACTAIVLFIVFATERADVYSPYYALNTVKEPFSYSILANGSLHQEALPLSRGRPLKAREAFIREGYHLPYRVLTHPPRRVLVLGAGSGNDVAVALDEGAQHVDAVEIDPRIIDIGRRIHPDQPYSSPRVRVINGDARAFLNDSQDTYDLVVFGTLDSMTRLSALSNVRLDNFVYTRECLAAAKRHLTPDGGIAMYFMVSEPYIERHIVAVLMDATGERPAVMRRHYNLFNRLFLSGPGFGLPQAALTPDDRNRLRSMNDIPTDDWPYLYLSGRGVSTFYLSLIAAILSIAVILVFGFSRDMRRSLTGGGFDAETFLFGIAFLMIETRLVTEMNLVWGATWLTSAVVFGSILLMVLAATLLMELRPLPWAFSALALLASLGVTYAVPVRLLVGRALGPRLCLSILFIGLPVFFASVCFAILFREREHPDMAFGWNMLGAVVGGLLEFTSMAIGIKATTLLAFVAYLAAMLVRERRKPADGTGVDGHSDVRREPLPAS